MSYYINGNWIIGFAIDEHTIKSILLGNGNFDTTYTEIGEKLNKLKYRKDYSKIKELSNIASKFIQENIRVAPTIDVIIPIPPTNKREIQPVEEVAKGIGKNIDIKVDLEYLFKIKDTKSLKNIENPVLREEIIKGSMSIKDKRYENKKILLFDDLYRSGTTLKEATKILYKVGKVKKVYVLTLTKTRLKR